MALAPRRRAADDARYHNELRRKVLEAHPEAANLIGPDWRTALFAVLMLALHWTVAWGVSRTSWWIAFLAAFVFGQTIYHSAGTLIHESAHRLVFRNAKARFAYDVLTEMIVTSFGYQLLYQHNHVTSHHAYLGDYERDYEHEDAYFVAARGRYRAAHPVRYRLMTIGIMILHLLPLTFIYDALVLPRVLGRATGLPPRDKTRKSPATRPARGELYALALVSLAVNVGLFMAFGFLGWLYHIWSLSMISGRWGASLRGQVLSEHYGEDAGHPTRSTYWWGNRIFYNIGYHVEHHTISGVPWTRLPRLHAIAPEFFDVGNELNYYSFWWKQVKSDFTLPRRVSATEAEAIIRRKPVEAPVTKQDDVPAASVAA
jgi:sphingolipid 4-desaturase/C4-monooxygenase